jgi:hypothetical protein
MHRTTAVEVAVCVPTYRRPDQLDVLLQALAGLDTTGLELTVVVVDDDPDRSAEPVLERHRRSGRLRLIHGHERTPGYVEVRNHLMRLVPAAAEWVAMIDDDSMPASPHWLRDLLSVALAGEADMACGPVLPSPPDDEVASSPGLSQAAVSFDKGPSGTPMRYGWAGNLLTRRSIIGVEPFDERFALTGAEDTEFTLRRTTAGHRLVWAPDAVVLTSVPREGLDPQRMIKVRRSGSAGLARAYQVVCGRLPRRVALRSVARLAESTASRALTRLAGDDEGHLAARLRQAGSIGMLQTGLFHRPPPRRIEVDEVAMQPDRRTLDR